MKKKLCQWIFRKELELEYKSLKEDYNRQLPIMKLEMKKNERKYGVLKRVFQLFPNAQIIGVEINK